MDTVKITRVGEWIDSKGRKRVTTRIEKEEVMVFDLNETTGDFTNIISSMDKSGGTA